MKLFLSQLLVCKFQWIDPSIYIRKSRERSVVFNFSKVFVTKPGPEAIFFPMLNSNVDEISAANKIWNVEK